MVGVQDPRLCSIPAYDLSRGEEVIELAESVGLVLDPWQRFCILHAHGVTGDRWAALEVAIEVARQNGKGGILEAVALAHLFLFESHLSIWSAHQFDTSFEAFMRLELLIDGSEELSRKIKRVSRSHGDEGFTTFGGSRIRFRTRTKGGGRGFACDGALILDEAMVISEMMHGALFPIVSAKPNPQIWYTGSAVDQDIHEHGLVFARLRERGHKGDDPRLMWAEWTAEVPDVPAGELELNHVDQILDSPEAWAQANPALGIRIDPEHVKAERRSMDPRTFAVERLGIGDWPDPDALAGQGIDIETWNVRADKDSVPDDPVCFAFDVTPNRSSSSICVAGRRADGKFHVEVVEHRPGTKWVVPRLVELVGEHDCVEKPVCDLRSPAAALLAQLEKADVEVLTSNSQEHAQAAGMLFDAVEDDELKHLGTPELAAAVRGAVKRPLGDAWAWSRRQSNVDISPLVGCTLAVWGLETQAPVASAPLIAAT